MDENISRWILMSINDTGIYYDNDYPADVEDQKSEIYVTLGILAFLSASGIIGNVLVLYVFTRKKPKLSSTIFILTLAGTDLISSLVTMPFTIAMELLHFNVDIDAVCKMYHLLATSAISFSASVMVAIAVDRYLCIVHPFKHTMTIKRAKVTVVLLAIFSTCIGLPSSLMYGVNKTYSRQMSTLPPSMASDNLTTRYSSIFDANNASQLSLEQIKMLLNESDITTHAIIINTGTCHKNELIVDKSFFNVYQKIYSSYFAICAVIVMILYFIIYRSVLIRRRKRFNLTSNCCVILMPGRNADRNDPGHMLTLTNTNKSPNDISSETINEDL